MIFGRTSTPTEGDSSYIVASVTRWTADSGTYNFGYVVLEERCAYIVHSHCYSLRVQNIARNVLPFLKLSKPWVRRNDRTNFEEMAQSSPCIDFVVCGWRYAVLQVIYEDIRRCW